MTRISMKQMFFLVGIFGVLLFLFKPFLFWINWKCAIGSFCYVCYPLLCFFRLNIDESIFNILKQNPSGSEFFGVVLGGIAGLWMYPLFAYICLVVYELLKDIFRSLK